MRILTFLLSSCILLGISGCTETNEHCKAGEFHSPEVTLTKFSASESSVESGIRTYMWEVGSSAISTNGIAQTIIRAYIEGSEQIIPVTLEWQKIVEGSESSFFEVTAIDTSLSSVYSYEVIDQADFSLTYTECEISYRIKVFARFQTTGQESFDDAYLEDVLFAHSSVKLGYFDEED